MRKFIRHPANVPIECQLNPLYAHQSNPLENVSIGGLSFQSPTPLPKNRFIRLRIPSVDPPFYATGTVVWCNKRDRDYVIGVKFIDQQTAFRMRMIEQVCHIEDYRKHVTEEEGRDISGEQAASEWIEKYAKDFPTL
ncbi:PilZ domain-containing protein [candidate division KSB1 bacterium]|nr:PilZ domain-containing protein [candidate division KSB1 bacterium]